MCLLNILKEIIIKNMHEFMKLDYIFPIYRLFIIFNFFLIGYITDQKKTINDIKYFRKWDSNLFLVFLLFLNAFQQKFDYFGDPDWGNI